MDIGSSRQPNGHEYSQYRCGAASALAGSLGLGGLLRPADPAKGASGPATSRVAGRKGVPDMLPPPSPVAGLTPFECVRS